MINGTLWRIEGISAATEIAYERLAEGLRLHVAHSPLSTLTMRIGTQQRWYVALAGCPGCARDQCRIGCPAALFRRLFASCVIGGELRAVAPPQGLACRPYTRGIFAWPTAESTPCTSTLEDWNDARLIVHWRRYGAQLCGSALLLASADGPDPATPLRAQQWRTIGLPAWMVARWSQPATPPALPFGAPWCHALFLLLPNGQGEAQAVDPEQRDANASTPVAPSEA